MPRLEPAKGVALPMVLGIVLAMGVSLVSVWREVRLQTWTTRQDVTRQQTRQALQALARDAQRDLQSGSAWLRNTQGPGCQAGVCTNTDTSLWSATQWAARASEGARFGEASATQIGACPNTRMEMYSHHHVAAIQARAKAQPRLAACASTASRSTTPTRTAGRSRRAS